MQAQVALGAVSEAERQSALTAVLQACDRATRLVAQLLQLARLDADGDLLGAGHCDAAVETRAILADLGPQLLAKRQEINLDAPDTLPLPMPPGLVGVLVGNLVDNAGRYSPVGARIHVQWQGLPRPQLLVQDSGPGMSEADVARLGHRFFRVPGSGADGSGLGWSIVRRLCQRYGLAVQLSQSPDGGGLQVRVTWPALVD
jgi:two-component system sensor histidine kinase QseC